MVGRAAIGLADKRKIGKRSRQNGQFWTGKKVRENPPKSKRSRGGSSSRESKEGN